jgi:Gpi18-like mannosyltransferase
MPVVKPRRNQMRITISILAYLIPILRRGLVLCFLELLCLFFVAFWLFTRYPIGGWSHAAFHLVMTLTPPLLMEAARTLEASQPALHQAAACMAN